LKIFLNEWPYCFLHYGWSQKGIAQG
jgi:hypothetical protein